MSASEIAWDWPEIAVILAWKLAPNGYVILREDLFTLPTDRVLLEDRREDALVLSFIGVKAAKKLTLQKRGVDTTTVSELQGRWQKIAITTLWHFARAGKLGRADSITLTEQDRAAVPGDCLLMASGHSQGVEWRFIPRALCKRQEDWDRENEGMMIREQAQL